MDSLYGLLLASGVGFLAYYIIEIVIPDLFYIKPQASLEDAIEAAKQHKEEVKKETEEINQSADNLKSEILKVQAESAVDEDKTNKKVEEATSSTESIKEFLTEEGFNVEEILPE